MTPGKWVLRAVEEFPARRLTLEALAEHHGAPSGKLVLTSLITDGTLVRYGPRNDARYGLPKKGEKFHKAFNRKEYMRLYMREFNRGLRRRKPKAPS